MTTKTIPDALRHRGRILLLAGALVWVNLWLIAGFLEQSRDYRSAGERAVSANAWQLGSPQVRRLENALQVLAAPIPEGAVIAFRAPRGGGGEGNRDFFAHMWASYLLPRHHIALARDPGSRQWARYGIDFRPAEDEPLPEGARLLARHPLGRSYLLPPAAP